MLKKILFTFSLIVSFSLNSVSAYYNPGEPEGYVNDFANTFTPSQETKLETVLEEFKRKTGSEIAVVIVKSFNGDTKENFAVKLFEDWKIGDTKDKGVLILVSRMDREIKVEVGYGLEGDLPDAYVSKEVLNKDVLGYLSKESYYSGISNAILKIFNRLNFKPSSEFVDTSSEPSPAVTNSVDNIYVYIGFAIIVLIAVILQKLGIVSGRRNDSWYDEEDKDPFKFGGGRSGGGGSGAKF